jgi:hypothetical protein
MKNKQKLEINKHERTAANKETQDVQRQCHSQRQDKPKEGSYAVNRDILSR